MEGPGQGRYALHGEIASGGMATVYFGRQVGAAGFTRTVAIKRLHTELAKDADALAMFLDEAWLAARIRHPNVVTTLDVVAGSEVFVVMEYIHGESLGKLLKQAYESARLADPRLVCTIVADALRGLDAAHEATNERGEHIGLVHRDVSPQNVHVGVDGVSRIIDFGVAKAAGRMQLTLKGQVKGKLAYMAPEQLRSLPVDRRTDVYAAGVVLWEALAGRRLFRGENEGSTIANVLGNIVQPPSMHRLEVSPALDAIVLRALDRDPDVRFSTAGAMADALDAQPKASQAEVADWCKTMGSEGLRVRAERLKQAEVASAPNGLAEAQQVVHRISSQTDMPSRSLIASTSPQRGWMIFAAAGVIVLGAALVAGLFAKSRARSKGMKPEPLASASAEAVAPSGPASAVVPPANACPEGMVSIPGGHFFMGADDPEAMDAQKPVHQVRLHAYCMDKHEVTARAYKACSDAGDCRRAGETNAWEGIKPKEQTAFDPLCNARAVETRGEHPINCVTWTMADTFCRAYGNRLPTEAEWEFAARGSDGRKYPWGDETPTRKRLNACGKECASWAARARVEAIPMYAEDDGFPATAPVGSFPDGQSVYGLHDVAGNVWEWVADWYAPYASDVVETPTGPATGEARVVRGGGWNGSHAAWVRPTFRFHQGPDERSHGVGFRCAR